MLGLFQKYTINDNTKGSEKFTHCDRDGGKISSVTKQTLSPTNQKPKPTLEGGLQKWVRGEGMDGDILKVL